MVQHMNRVADEWAVETVDADLARHDSSLSCAGEIGLAGLVGADRGSDLVLLGHFAPVRSRVLHQKLGALARSAACPRRYCLPVADGQC